MIKHIIRKEHVGGYWLLRDAGRVVNLSAEAFGYLSSMVNPISPAHEQAHNRSDLDLSSLAEIRFLAQKYDIKDSAKRGEIHWITTDGATEILPSDADAAPKRIYFELTRRCNLACHSCFNSSHYALPDELTLEEVLDVNHQAAEIGVFEIRYTGGECTILPWFPEVVADARSKGMYVSVGTNGVFSDEIRDWLQVSGIDWIIISLDGDEVTNDRVRGRGTYNEVLKTLKALQQCPHMRIRLNMVVARHNLKAINAVAKVAAEHAVESLNLIPLRPYGRSLHHMVHNMLTQSEFYDFITEINRLRHVYPQINFSTTIDLLDPAARTSRDLIVEKRRTCAAGVEACVIGPQGDIYGCSYSPASFPDSTDIEGRHIFVAGNLRQHSLSAVWRDSSRWAVFRNLDQYKYNKCKECTHYRIRCSGSCPIMAWYEMGRSKSTSLSMNEVCDPYCFVDLMTDDHTTRPV
jgi:radical SAM protein with 4Fe4S-binding SPASM domain